MFLIYFSFFQFKMPNTYKRKTNRQTWSSDQMEMVIESVKSKEMGYLKASLMYQHLKEGWRVLIKFSKEMKRGLGVGIKPFPQKLKTILWNTYKKWKECFMGSLHKMLGHWHFRWLRRINYLITFQIRKKRWKSMA